MTQASTSASSPGLRAENCTENAGTTCEPRSDGAADAVVEVRQEASASRMVQWRTSITTHLDFGLGGCAQLAAITDGKLRAAD